ncbi:MAG: FeoB-associated Cys-rich membrane protein [Gemmataceae bacterium]|nr:FeoB-associated Cys-rich membrane protein [Gemmataceae bacterium]
MQLTVTLIVVGLAAGYVARATWRTWAGRKSGCGSGCGSCSAAKPQPPADPPGRVGLPMAG